MSEEPDTKLDIKAESTGTKKLPRNAMNFLRGRLSYYSYITVTKGCEEWCKSNDQPPSQCHADEIVRYINTLNVDNGPEEYTFEQIQKFCNGFWRNFLIRRRRGERERIDAMKEDEENYRQQKLHTRMWPVAEDRFL
jgi:hypothetical protein